MLDLDMSSSDRFDALKKHFYRVGTDLLLKHEIELRHVGQRLRISSVELYFHKVDVWEDPAVHKHPQQKSAGRWYVHRRGERYRGPRRRCVDITCGSEKAGTFGGILVRGVEDIDGPALALNQMVFGRPERPRCWDYKGRDEFFDGLEQKDVYSGDVVLIEAKIPRAAKLYVGARRGLRYEATPDGKKFNDSELRISTVAGPGVMRELSGFCP